MHSNLIAAFSHRTGLRLGEIAGLLFLIGGVWLAAAQLPVFPYAKGRTTVAGILFAAAGVLLIVAIRWASLG